jgi:hypothetical protein
MYRALFSTAFGGFTKIPHMTTASHKTHEQGVEKEIETSRTRLRSMFSLPCAANGRFLASANGAQPAGVSRGNPGFGGDHQCVLATRSGTTNSPKAVIENKGSGHQAVAQMIERRDRLAAVSQGSPRLPSRGSVFPRPAYAAMDFWTAFAALRITSSTAFGWESIGT